MKKRYIILIIIIAIFIAIVIGIALKNKLQNSHEFLLDSDYKYIVETNTKASTLTANGEYYSTYYEIDLLEKTIEQRSDHHPETSVVYSGLIGMIKNLEYYTGKLIAEGELTDSQVEQLKELLDNRISEGDYEEELDDEETDYINMYIEAEDINNWKIYYKDFDSVIMSSDEKEEFLEIISTSL